MYNIPYNMIEKHNNTSRAAQLNNKRREYCERTTIEKKHKREDW